MAHGNQQRVFVSIAVVIVAVTILIAGVYIPGNKGGGGEEIDQNDPNARSAESGEGLSLHAAAATGNLGAITAALDGGDRIDALYAGQDTSMAQMTPLMLAAAGGHTTTVEELIKRDAQLDTARTGGMTALMFAARSGHADTLLVLLNSGASLHARTQRDRGPLFFAAESGSAESISILLDAQLDPNRADQDGITPLMLAAQAGSKDAVLLLLNAGADPNATDNAGRNALSLVEGRPDPEGQATHAILYEATRP